MSQELLLGQHTVYPTQYDPGLLFPVPRLPKWQELGFASALELPFVGEDLWQAFELSWLNAKGKPIVAVAEFRIPLCSANIIESKSFKLYLNSLNQQVFNSWQAVEQCLVADLSQAAGAPVGVMLLSPGQADGYLAPQRLLGTCLDNLDVQCQHYQPAPELLALGKRQVQQLLFSHLLKSNCPVTGQPDWATVIIDYQGTELQQPALLQYLVSFRQHSDFHEQCVERIFTDLWRLGGMQKLTVTARYLRRGGLDINPWRSSHQPRAQNKRLIRQ